MFYNNTFIYRLSNHYKRIQKRKNHQNSDLDALPEKLKKFLYAETTESKKFMF